jgi:hypothetical protein
MGNLMDTYYSSSTPVIVGIRGVVDQTGTPMQPHMEIPAQLTGMIETALNSVSRRIRFSELMMEGATSKNALYPNFILSGGITEFDRGVDQKASSLDLGTWLGKFIESLDGSYSSTSASTRLGIDLHLLDFKTQVSTPGVHASLRLELTRESTESKMSVSIYGVTLGYSRMAKHVEGAHGALRLMVNLGVAQIVGRQFRLPWNRCVDDGPEDDRIVKDAVVAAYESAKPAARKRMLDSVLTYYQHGDYSTARGSLPQLRSAGGADSQKYWSLYKNIPVPGLPTGTDHGSN